MPLPKFRLNLFGNKTAIKYHTHGPEKGQVMHENDHKLRDIIAKTIHDGRNAKISNLELKKGLSNSREKYEPIKNVTDDPLRHTRNRLLRILKESKFVPKLNFF